MRALRWIQYECFWMDTRMHPAQRRGPWPPQSFGYYSPRMCG